MDIFNRKRVVELEARLRGLEDVRRENDELKSMLRRSESELKLALALKNSIPEDCNQGQYCEACTFAKKFNYHTYGYFSGHETLISGIMCGKGESCKNFIQKEIKE